MAGHLVVLITAGSGEEAQEIARRLVEERLAACVNIVSSLESVYRWQGQVQDDREVLLLAKTTTGRFDKLAARVKELHSYQVPEIIAVPIVAGAGEYLEWVDEQTGGIA